MRRGDRVVAYGDINIPIPGTDFTKWASALSDYLSLNSWFDAADIAGKVKDAYSAASAAQGTPYVAGTTAGEAMAQTIAQQTGLSFGRVKAALNVLQNLATSGQIGNDTYNPGQYSIGAKVSQAITSGIAGTKKIVQEVTPQAVQDLVSGAGDAVSGVGTLLKFLPWIAVAGVGGWILIEVKNGRNPLERLRQ